MDVSQSVFDVHCRCVGTWNVCF